MVIHSARLTLRSLREDDWRNLQHIWSDFEHSEYGQYDCSRIFNAREIRVLMLFSLESVFIINSPSL